MTEGNQRTSAYENFLNFCGGNQNLMFFLSQYCTDSAYNQSAKVLLEKGTTPVTYNGKKAIFSHSATIGGGAEFIITENADGNFTLTSSHTMKERSLILSNKDNTVEMLENKFDPEQTYFITYIDLKIPKSMKPEDVKLIKYSYEYNLAEVESKK